MGANSAAIKSAELTAWTLARMQVVPLLSVTRPRAAEKLREEDLERAEQCRNQVSVDSRDILAATRRISRVVPGTSSTASGPLSCQPLARSQVFAATVGGGRLRISF